MNLSLSLCPYERTLVPSLRSSRWPGWLAGCIPDGVYRLRFLKMTARPGRFSRWRRAGILLIPLALLAAPASAIWLRLSLRVEPMTFPASIRHRPRNLRRVRRCPSSGKWREPAVRRPSATVCASTTRSPCRHARGTTSPFAGTASMTILAYGAISLQASFITLPRASRLRSRPARTVISGELASRRSPTCADSTLTLPDRPLRSDLPNRAGGRGRQSRRLFRVVGRELALSQPQRELPRNLLRSRDHARSARSFINAAQEHAALLLTEMLRGKYGIPAGTA